MLFHKGEREMQCRRCCHGKIAIIYNNIIYHFKKIKLLMFLSLFPIHSSLTHKHETYTLVRYFKNGNLPLHDRWNFLFETYW